MRKVCVGAWILAWLIVLAVSLVGCFEDAPRMLPPEPLENDTVRRASPVIVPNRPYVTVYFVEPSFRNSPLTEEDYQGWVARINTVFRTTQAFFADELERYGHGRKTFPVLATADGRVVVKRHQLPESDAYYAADRQRINVDIAALGIGDEHEDTYRVFIVNVSSMDVCGTGSGTGCICVNTSGYVVIWAPCLSRFVLAHELGHAFGLQHDWRSASFVMSYGELRQPGDTTPMRLAQSEFSPGAAGWLARMPAFTGRIPSEGRHDLITTLDVKHVSPVVTRPGWFDVELSFRVWTYDVMEGRLRPSSDAVTQAGFAHGVLLDASAVDVLGEVLVYFDRDDLQGTFYPAGTGVTARHIVENLPDPRHAYMEYTLQFQAYLPEDLKDVLLEILTEDGYRVRGFLKAWEWDTLRNTAD